MIRTCKTIQIECDHEGCGEYMVLDCLMTCTDSYLNEVAVEALRRKDWKNNGIGQFCKAHSELT